MPNEQITQSVQRYPRRDASHVRSHSHALSVSRATSLQAPNTPRVSSGPRSSPSPKKQRIPRSPDAHSQTLAGAQAQPEMRSHPMSAAEPQALARSRACPASRLCSSEHPPSRSQRAAPHRPTSPTHHASLRWLTNDRGALRAYSSSWPSRSSLAPLSPNPPGSGVPARSYALVKKGLICSRSSASLSSRSDFSAS